MGKLCSKIDTGGSECSHSSYEERSTRTGSVSSQNCGDESSSFSNQTMNARHGASANRYGHLRNEFITSSQDAIIPFSKPFLPELRAMILDLLDRQDILNYSLCCKEFNAESMRIVWSVLDLPAPVYHSSRGCFEDACRAIARVPERGQYVKRVTFLCSYHQMPWLFESTTERERAKLAKHTFELLSRVQSLSLTKMIADPQLEEPQLTKYGAMRDAMYGLIHRWTMSIPLVRLQTVYVSMDYVIPMLESCSNIRHLSLRVPRAELHKMNSITLSPTILPLLCSLEIDLQAIPLFVGPRRCITSLTVHGAAGCDSETITAVGRSIREANTVHTLQFSGGLTSTTEHVLSLMSPLPSLRTLVESDRSSECMPIENNEVLWLYDLGKAIRRAPSVETFIMAVVHLTNDAWDTPEYAKSFAKLFDDHLPPILFPNLHRMVFEASHDGIPGVNLWIYERAENWTWRVEEGLKRENF